MGAVPNCNAPRVERDARPAIGQCAAMPIVDTAPERRSSSDRRRTALPPIVADLRIAIDRGEIEILFQPQYAASDGKLVGAEALARWRHPAHGRIAGDRLFEIAGKGGLVEALSHHIARVALGTAGSWPAPIRLSLNVTAEDVAAGDFAENVVHAVAQAGFPAEHLTLEITEQVLLADVDRTAEQLSVSRSTTLAPASATSTISSVCPSITSSSTAP